MKLTRSQREHVRMKFGGRCAYCGEILGARWHADHLDPVLRIWWGAMKGDVLRRENDTIENLMPACAPCNIGKSAMPLEEWRKHLSRAPGVLSRNQPTYRHAVRFGLVVETAAPVVFYFEKLHKSDMEVSP